MATAQQAGAQRPAALALDHRGLVGRVIVLAKKFVYQAFMKWFMSSLIEQQNAFNRASTQALRDLFERQRDLAKETRRLAAAVERDDSEASGGG